MYTFYRVGDFYEMFYDDALEASRVLEIALTGKNCGQEERAPMCGVPFILQKLTFTNQSIKDIKVGICEQVEDPATAKGIVKRDVIKNYNSGNPNLTDDAK